jgi:hypothetical protein
VTVLLFDGGESVPGAGRVPLDSSHSSFAAISIKTSDAPGLVRDQERWIVKILPPLDVERLAVGTAGGRS